MSRLTGADLLRTPALWRTRGDISSGQSPISGSPNSPHTPLLSRSLSSQYGSPGYYRAEDEHLVLEMGARYVRIGFAGESGPRTIWQFSPDANRRAGEYSTCNDRAKSSQDWELWDFDDLESLKIVESKLERALRRTIQQYVQQDIKTRSAILLLPSGIPNVLLELVTRTLFSLSNRPAGLFPVPAPIAATVAAGLRSALVIDVDWHRTTLTAVYEYRIVHQRLSNRAGKRIHFEAKRFLRRASINLLSFSAIEDFISNNLWCLPSSDQSRVDPEPHAYDEITSIPREVLAAPVELALMRTKNGYDDHDAPLPDLIFGFLVSLPVDVRSTCISRIIFTGGSSEIPGLRSRLLHEIQQWLEHDNLCQTMPRFGSRRKNNDNAGQLEAETNVRMAEVAAAKRVYDVVFNCWTPMAAEGDFVEENFERRRPPPPVEGVVRCVESLGAWAGGSIIGHLRAEVTTEIRRDDFMKHGLSVLGYPI